MTLAQQQLGARGLVPVFPPPGGGCEVWVCHQAGVGVAGEGGGAPCAPIMPIVDTVLCPTQGSRAPLGSLPPPPASPARAVLRLSSHTRVRPRGGRGCCCQTEHCCHQCPCILAASRQWCGHQRCWAATWTFKFECGMRPGKIIQDVGLVNKL